MRTSHDELAFQVQRLTEEVAILRQVLDEIREDLSWALRNDRLLVVPVDQHQSVSVESSTDESPRERLIDDPPRRQGELW